MELGWPNQIEPGLLEAEAFLVFEENFFASYTININTIFTDIYVILLSHENAQLYIGLSCWALHTIKCFKIMCIVFVARFFYFFCSYLKLSHDRSLSVYFFFPRLICMVSDFFYSLYFFMISFRYDEKATTIFVNIALGFLEENWLTNVHCCS